MKIPMELLNKWKGLRSRGDNKRVNDLLEKPLDQQSAVTVFGRAFNRGECPDHIFKVLNQFYTAKELELFPPAQKSNHE